MPRRASDRYPDEKRPCSFCRTLRVVIMFAVLLLALLAYSDNLTWLQDIQFIDIFAASIGVAFVLVVAYKIWEEYGRPKEDRAIQKEERRQAMEKLFDEMDEAVAKREAEEATLRVTDAETGETLVAEVHKDTEHEELVTDAGDTVVVDRTTVTMEVHVEEPQEVEIAKARADDAEPEVVDAEIIEEVIDAEAVDESKMGSDESHLTPSSDKEQPEQLDIFGFELERK